MAVGRYTIEVEVEADLENNLLPSRKEIEGLRKIEWVNRERQCESPRLPADPKP